MKYLVWLVLVSGCGLTTQVRPTPKDTIAVQASVGGPIADIGAPVPLPFLAVGAAWGFHQRADLSLHTHLSTLVLSRVFGVDLGGSVLFVENHDAVPAVTLGLRGYVFTDFRSATQGFYESSLAVSWDIGRFRPFIACALQLDARALQFDFAPAIGTEIRFGALTLVADLKWYGPSRNTTISSVQWLAPFGHGAIGFLIGARYDFKVPAP